MPPGWSPGWSPTKPPGSPARSSTPKAAFAAGTNAVTPPQPARPASRHRYAARPALRPARPRRIWRRLQPHLLGLMRRTAAAIVGAGGYLDVHLRVQRHLGAGRRVLGLHRAGIDAVVDVR